MNEMDIRQGTIVYDSGRGWLFAEDSADGLAIFVHMHHSADQKCLHIGDVVAFERVASTVKPGKFEAREIRRIVHTVARQVGGTQVPR
jgi:cold shock CspA family protein